MTNNDLNSGNWNQPDENIEKGTLPIISDSWIRCSDYGLDASGKPEEPVLSEKKFRGVLEHNESIRRLVVPELELLYNQIAGTNFMVAYADGNGVVLDSIQDHDFLAGKGGKAVIPGSIWKERQRGTNALGLAVHTRRPVIVTGQDHFFHTLNDLSCFAAPFFDHENNLMGVIDATSNAKSRNEHTLALVKLASRNIENRLFTKQFCDSLILIFHARQEYLMTTNVAMIAVDEYGFIKAANANAKSVLNGIDIGHMRHLGGVFEVNFFDFVDKLRSNGTITIKDKMGSVVFMKAQSPISGKAVNIDVGQVTKQREINSLLGKEEFHSKVAAPKKSTRKLLCTFEDEILVNEIASAAHAMAHGLPVTIVGDNSTGKTEIAREIHKRVFGETKLTIIDCRLLNSENFEGYLYGECAKVSFYDRDIPNSKEGKLSRSRGGAVLLKNAHTLNMLIQDEIAEAINYEQLQLAEYPSINGWFLSGPVNWMGDGEFELSARFENAINGRRLTSPTLSQRSDFPKIALAFLASCSDEHILSPIAMKILEKESWPGNFMQLNKAIRHAVSQSKGKVIRHEIRDFIKDPYYGGIKPCSSCLGSPVKEKTCIMIQRSWKETGGKVSLVAQRLGVSRNTVYKHVRENLSLHRLIK